VIEFQKVTFVVPHGRPVCFERYSTDTGNNSNLLHLVLVQELKKFGAAVRSPPIDRTGGINEGVLESWLISKIHPI